MFFWWIYNIRTAAVFRCAGSWLTVVVGCTANTHSLYIELSIYTIGYYAILPQCIEHNLFQTGRGWEKAHEPARTDLNKIDKLKSSPL